MIHADFNDGRGGSIGANMATNAGGPHTLKYGVTVDHVLGVEAVLGDGSIVQLGPVENPAGEIKHDEFFGDVAVFHNEIQARVPLTRANGDATDINVQLGYQGCAEAGICYPPIKKQLAVTLAAYDPGNAPATALAQVQAATTNNTDTSLSSMGCEEIEGG